MRIHARHYATGQPILIDWEAGVIRSIDTGQSLPAGRTDTWVAPALFDDELEIVTRIDDYSFVRLTFAYEVRRVRDGVLCAEGRTVLAAVDRKGEPRKLPADLRAYLERLPLPDEQERRRRSRAAGGA